MVMLGRNSNPEPAVGLAGLQAKLEGWNQLQEGVTWRAVSVNLGKNSIAIEWDADVKLRGGPTVNLREVAIHDVKGGKIVAERFYYDPAQMGGGANAEPEPAPAPAPAAEPQAQAADDPVIGEAPEASDSRAPGSDSDPA